MHRSQLSSDEMSALDVALADAAKVIAAKAAEQADSHRAERFAHAAALLAHAAKGTVGGGASTTPETS